MGSERESLALVNHIPAQCTIPSRKPEAVLSQLRKTKIISNVLVD